MEIMFLKAGFFCAAGFQLIHVLENDLQTKTENGYFSKFNFSVLEKANKKAPCGAFQI
jgi:hypothetical protein